MNNLYHEVANIFPMMSADEFTALKSDIAENGLIEPIWFYEGQIIDGRNRWQACKELGISPQTREWSGDGSLVSFVVSLNLKRRHLSQSQLGAVALSVEKAIAEQAKEQQREAGRLYGENHPQEVLSTLIKPLDTAPIHAAKEAAKIVGVSNGYIIEAKRIEREAPELITEILAGNMSIPEAKKEIKKRERETLRSRMAQSVKDIKPDERYNIYTGDMQTLNTGKRYDFIITDPPYLKEYIQLYEVLAKRAADDWLKDGGLLVAMCGQSYLDQIYQLMAQHLTYYWTAAYLTPGQPTPLRQRQVNTTWKPLLIFAKGDYNGKIFGDVFKSDKNEKDHHKWGQSESGMLSVVSGICLPGQSILDPFCGAGTTGVAALKHGCTFDGIEIDETNIGISINRMSNL